MWGRFRSRVRATRQRLRRNADIGDGSDLVDGCFVDSLEIVAIVLLVIVVVVLLILVGIPLLIALGELLVVVVLGFVGIIGRVVFRRPWIVDAVGPFDQHHEWRVVGWTASGDARNFVAQQLEQRGVPPRDDEVPGALFAYPLSPD